MLVLRSGIGSGPPLSRARTGARLDLATRRIARIERRGLRQLRAAARDGCGGGGRGEAFVETVLASTSGGGSSPAAGGSGASGGDAAGSGVKGAFDESDGGGGNGGGDADKPPAVFVPPIGAGDGGGLGGLSIAASLLGLMMLGYAVRRELRARGPAHG